MGKINYQNSRLETEKRLLNLELGFSASYLAVKSLRSHITKFPQSITHNTVDALAAVMESERFASQSRVFFLYSEISETLVSITSTNRDDLSGRIIFMMQEILLNSSNDRHRAVALALGSLPLKIKSRDSSPVADSTATEISFQKLILKLGIIDDTNLAWQGRSLTGTAHGNRLGIIKLLKPGDNSGGLIKEAMWMDQLPTMDLAGSLRFDIPTPLMVHGRPLLKIVDIPGRLKPEFDRRSQGHAIAFNAAIDYFRYPNQTGHGHPIPKEEFKEVICRTARLLGRLASIGIIHTALIPLFHNRIQQNRRADNGIYDWKRGGRLDRWLASCRHPNFASSGIRDFEHLAFFKDSKTIHHHIGSHLLSLILVTGSYFRSFDPEKLGLDSDKKPVDTRSLFDSRFFENLVKALTTNYYDGFSDSCCRQECCLPADLVHRMIQAMGVDHHMEEILRIDDQNRMDQKLFETFLETRGVAKTKTGLFQKGEKEIILQTGPHLGGFNQRISIPELIDFIFSSATICISTRYAMENGLKHYEN